MGLYLSALCAPDEGYRDRWPSLQQPPELSTDEVPNMLTGRWGRGVSDFFDNLLIIVQDPDELRFLRRLACQAQGEEHADELSLV